MLFVGPIVPALTSPTDRSFLEDGTNRAIFVHYAMHTIKKGAYLGHVSLHRGG